MSFSLTFPVIIAFCLSPISSQLSHEMALSKFKAIKKILFNGNMIQTRFEGANCAYWKARMLYFWPMTVVLCWNINTMTIESLDDWILVKISLTARMRNNLRNWNYSMYGWLFFIYLHTTLFIHPLRTETKIFVRIDSTTLKKHHDVIQNQADKIGASEITRTEKYCCWFMISFVTNL